ncbi:unnamed protein product [Mytilus coruscus]|uniref:Peptidase A2 domain-containing protein n=1 Tax=Mytilus coruscus TaxID=42192 RepID=A0A6J8E1J2_MYTCO|nr:unnamed protein product [Mytilus coruscus]
MRLRIKQARPVDLNDAVRHAVELEAFNKAEITREEGKGYLRATNTDADISDTSDKTNTPNGLEVSHEKQNGVIGVNKLANEAGMFIEAKVNCSKAKMLIDTGATVSLISKKIFDSMHAHVLLPMDREILTANGSPLILFGKTIIDIDLNGYVCSNIAVVADLNIDGILGIDFERNQNCVINLTKSSIWVNGIETRLHFEGTIRGPVLPNQQVGIVEPTQEFVDTNKGLLGRILVKNQEKVPLRFMNLSDETQTIHEGTIVGQLSSVEEIIVSEPSERIIESSLPAHMHQLYKDTIENMSENKKKLVKNFL